MHFGCGSNLQGTGATAASSTSVKAHGMNRHLSLDVHNQLCPQKIPVLGNRRSRLLRNDEQLIYTRIHSHIMRKKKKMQDTTPNFLGIMKRCRGAGTVLRPGLAVRKKLTTYKSWYSASERYASKALRRDAELFHYIRGHARRREPV